MSNNIGILRVHLHNLERAAETLERIIYNDLVALESLPDKEVEGYEPRVWRKLERLDELQDEMDAAIAKLKAAGAYEPVSHSVRVYEYMPPSAVRPRPKPKVTVVRASTARSDGYWDKLTATMPETGGLTTAKEVMDLIQVSRVRACDLITKWVDEEKMAFSQYSGGAPAYCKYVDRELHEESLILSRITDEPISITALSKGLGHTKKTLPIQRKVDEYVKAGKIEEVTVGSRKTYRLPHEKDSHLV